MGIKVLWRKNFERKSVEVTRFKRKINGLIERRIKSFKAKILIIGFEIKLKIVYWLTGVRNEGQKVQN